MPIRKHNSRMVSSGHSAADAQPAYSARHQSLQPCRQDSAGQRNPDRAAQRAKKRRGRRGRAQVSPFRRILDGGGQIGERNPDPKSKDGENGFRDGNTPAGSGGPGQCRETQGGRYQACCHQRLVSAGVGHQPATADRGDDYPSHHRGNHEARRGRARALDQLEIQRQEHRRGEHAHRGQGDHKHAQNEDGAAEQSGGQQRFRGSPLVQDQQPYSNGGGPRQSEDRR